MLNNTEYPIDFVLTWVDGSDPEWISEKTKYSQMQSSSVHSFDYQDYGLLQYWFRCIEKNAPWVRNIYFITCGHLPKWLNINHPKLKIIKHTDYIPKKYLPTFSSHTIELNFHRITGLSEHFVYFNDDMFLIKPVEKDFFFINGLPRDCAIINPVAPATSNCIANLMITITGMINENFSKREIIKKNCLNWINIKYFPLIFLNFFFIPWKRFVGLYKSHIPTSMLKSTYEEVWKKEYEILDATCKRKFRDFKVDVNQWLIKDWQIANGNFIPRTIYAGKFFDIRNIENAIGTVNIIEKEKVPMICINDHIEDETYTEAAKIIRKAFDKNYSQKSNFEM